MAYPDFKSSGGKWVKHFGLDGKTIITDVGQLHYSMMARCTDGSGAQAKAPTYQGCSADDVFKDFQKFSVWAHEQVGYGERDSSGRVFHLDKDLLCKGNKVYGADYCVFIPQVVNVLLVKSDKTRGVNPIGVCYDKSRGKYHSSLFIDNCKVNLGRFWTADSAFQAYKHAKEKELRRKAEEFKGRIDPRAYQALINYNVEITD